MLSYQASSPYLNVLYQLLYSMKSFVSLLRQFEVPSGVKPSPAIKLMGKLKEMVKLLDDSGPKIMTAPVLEDELRTLFTLSPDGEDHVPFPDFLDAFLRLMRRGWLEAYGDTQKIDRMMTMLWGPQSSPTASVTGQPVNPIKLNVGKKSCTEAMETYFASGVGGILTEQNRPELSLIPSFLFVTLNWSPQENSELHDVLPFFNPKLYVKSSTRVKCIAMGFLFENINRSRYVLQVKKRKLWVQLADTKH